MATIRGHSDFSIAIDGANITVQDLEAINSQLSWVLELSNDVSALLLIIDGHW